MPQAATSTVRVSRRTHEVLTELAGAAHQTMAEYLDQLIERARRQRLLDEHAAAMQRILADRTARDAYEAETRGWLEQFGDSLQGEPPYPLHLP